MLRSRANACAIRAASTPTSKRARLSESPHALRLQPASFVGRIVSHPALPSDVPRSFLSGSTPAGFQRFRTSTQNFYNYDTKALAVGESNQGIVSEKSKWIHTKQTM